MFKGLARCLEGRRKGRHKQSGGVEVLSGASNVYLHNVQMHVAGRDLSVTHVHQQPSSADLEIQASLWRLPDPRGCSWDPSRTCFTGTRSTHLVDISSWIEAEDTTAKVLVIADAVGSGKSALAHTICQEADKEGQLIVGFFFNQMDQQSTPNNFMAALVRGLCGVSEHVKRRIGQLILEDGTLASAPVIRQFERLVLPICSLLPNNRLFVVVVDALDEELDTVILELIRDFITQLPPCFRIIITARPEPRITQYLENQHHITRFSRSLTGETSHVDLEVYINSRLARSSYGKSVSPELLQDFIARTEGMFLWAATVLNHLDNSFDALAELRDIVHSKSAHWQEGQDATKKLHDLYLRILSKLMWTDHRFVVKYNIVVGAIVTVKQPLSVIGLASLYGWDGITVADVDRICTLIQPLLRNYSRHNPRQPIRLLHLSVKDFLNTHAPSPYHLDCDEHHLKLSQLALLAVKQDLKPTNVPALGYTEGDWAWDGSPLSPDIPVVRKGTMPEHLWYACRFLESHILDTPVSLIERSHVELMHEILLLDPRPFLEVTASMGMTANIERLKKRVTQLSAIDLDQETLREVARTYYAIAKCLDNAWRSAEALSIIEEGTKIYQKISSDSDKEDPTLDLELILSLNLFSLCLENLHRYDEALQTIQLALDLARELVQADPKSLQPFMARLLLTQGVILERLGRHEDGLAADLESVAIYRRLVLVDGKKFEADLAWSLYNLACDYSKMGRYDEAIVPIEESIDIRRKLAANDPVTFESILASSLHTYAYYLSSLGRHHDALLAIREAVSIRRRLATANPTKYETRLSHSLHALASHLNSCNRAEDAISVALEVIALRRRFTDKDPQGFSPHLADSLHNQALFLAGLNRFNEAVGPSTEAVCIRRDLAKLEPAKYGPELALSLASLASHLASSQRIEEAIPVLEEVIGIRRGLAEGDPGAFDYILADSLYNCALLLARAGRLLDALQPNEQAISLHRRLAARDPASLASSLYNMACSLHACERHEHAVAAVSESADIRRRLVVGHGAAFDPVLANSLHNHAYYLAVLGRSTEAVEVGEEAAVVLRRLVDIDPTLYEARLANTLYNLACDLGSCGKFQDAVIAAQEAVGIRRGLANKCPAVFRPALAGTLHGNAWLSVQLGDGEGGGKVAEEAVALYGRLAAEDPVRFEGGLGNALYCLAACMALRGMYDSAVVVVLEGLDVYRRSLSPQSDFNRGGFSKEFYSYTKVLTHSARGDSPVEIFQEVEGFYRLAGEATSPSEIKVKLGWGNSQHE
ncbi:TPR-like protein [Coprinopsis marcescibilis]|uniref:TPR-like protein n=1 Tax=Coprinopsis marcescibilis TaxID=230819 RepID=A0A5C3KWY8_COPMA|nr:TPR-like protein [Coprinopsis marcescibilis]